MSTVEWQSSFLGKKSDLANNSGKRPKTAENNTFLDFDKKWLQGLSWFLAWCDVSRDDSLSLYANHMSRKILVFKLWPKNLLANQITRLLFQTLTIRNFKNDFKEFSEFLHDDSGDDSLPSRTNCMSRRILVPELWAKKFLASQIVRLLFQTLTRNDFKKFSEFLHNDSRDNSLPSCTNCMSRKTLVRWVMA